MDVLFQTTLSSESNDTYDVSFENDVYVFTPRGSGKAPFRVRRAHDEWQFEGDDGEKATAATKALDDYLLSQH